MYPSHTVAVLDCMAAIGPVDLMGLHSYIEAQGHLVDEQVLFSIVDQLLAHGAADRWVNFDQEGYPEVDYVLTGVGDRFRLSFASVDYHFPACDLIAELESVGWGHLPSTPDGDYLVDHDCYRN